MHGIEEHLCPNRDRSYTCDDITAVYCLRAHATNRWVFERLRLVASHYQPRPPVLICDFGSAPPQAAKIRRICREEGLRYHRVDDEGLYSPAAARNRAFEATTTDLVFFCDIDTFGRASLFSELAMLASTLRMNETVDLVLAAPILHLSEVDTRRIMAGVERGERSATMDRIALEYLYRGKDREANAFVVPYSNNFLIHRNFFNLSGGYDERFRGHGSEDFEFLLRLHFYSKHLPLPEDPVSDKNSPMRDEFYAEKHYAGFRRLFEAQAYPAEHFGLRVFHLWHPRNDGEWTNHNDWKRERFNEAVSGYMGNERGLLSVDALARPKKVLCVCKHSDHWGYFAPLRLAGYSLVPLYDDAPGTLAEATEAIASGTVDAIAVFNPYMWSHAAFKPLFLLAQERGVRTIVIERGALPSTIYYDDDVAHASVNFGEAAFAAETYTDQEIISAADYVTKVRRGQATLESMASYEATEQRYPGLKLLNRPICFIPTQLEDDMAVTHFATGFSAYSDFVGSLSDVIRDNPDVLFVVKPHPLSKLADMSGQANLIVAKSDDNIHFLIDCARWVVCYNSGVGLLSLLHGKPTITIGNTFYNYSGAGHRAATLADAVSKARLEPTAPSPDMVRRLAAWFMLRKYSTFCANDDIREFDRRKAHAYKDILVTQFRWGGSEFKLGRMKQSMPISNQSYLWARIGMEPRAVPTPATPNQAPSAKLVPAAPKPAAAAAPKPQVVRPWGPMKKAIHGSARIALRPTLNEKDRERLERDPVDFFKKAKWPPNRFFGRLLLDKSQRPY